MRRLRGRRRRAATAALGTLLVAVALGAAACGGGASLSAPHDAAPHGGSAHHLKADAKPTRTSLPPVHTTTTTAAAAPPTTTSTAVPPTTAPPPAPAPPSTTVPPGAGQHGPITEPPLPSPGPGFVADQVTAIGDSVMLDYEGALTVDIPGVHVTAAVSRQWTQGESILGQLKAEGALGAVVIVGLGTNGPITTTQFDSMMTVVSGASRVVFVNIRVDRTWQDSNDAVLQSGVSRYPNAVLANWLTLALANPGWLYSTQTHLPIDGTGADALAALVAGAA